MSNLVTIAVLQDAINNLGLPEKITRTQLEYWRAGSRAVIRALNEAIQAAPSVSGGAQSDQKQPESRSNTRLGGGAQACPEGGANWSHPEPLQWVHEDDLAKLISDDTYNALFPYSKVDFVRMFPIFGPPAKSDAPTSASINELSAFRLFIAKKGISDGYMGDGVFQGRIQLAWEAWLARAEAAAVPVPPADKAGVSGSEAPMSDKPACGAQSSEYDPQAQREVA